MGTPGYIPPEGRKGYGPFGYEPGPFDVWSAGTILFYLVAGEEVFRKVGGGLCFRLIESIITKKVPALAGFMDEKTCPITNAPMHTKLWA